LPVWLGLSPEDFEDEHASSEPEEVLEPPPNVEVPGNEYDTQLLEHTPILLDEPSKYWTRHPIVV